MKRLLLPLLLLGLVVPRGARADVLSFDHDGLQVDAGSMGAFTWSYPAMLKDGGAAYKILTVTGNGNSATVTYEGGGQPLGRHWSGRRGYLYLLAGSRRREESAV
ncbi:MAG: hypothetical protein WDO13_07185 [Verrucomicrobiota bacterium]